MRAMEGAVLGKEAATFCDILRDEEVAVLGEEAAGCWWLTPPMGAPVRAMEGAVLSEEAATFCDILRDEEPDVLRDEEVAVLGGEAAGCWWLTPPVGAPVRAM